MAAFSESIFIRMPNQIGCMTADLAFELAGIGWPTRAAVAVYRQMIRQTLPAHVLTIYEPR